MIRIGVIGYGSRMSGVCRLLRRTEPTTRVVAITDPRKDEIIKFIRESENIKEDPDKITFYEDPDEMLKTEDLDGVMIGTRCHMHTPMAVKVAKTGLPLYLEKPVAVSMEQAKKLRKAFKDSSCEVVVSFPLRVTPLVQIAEEVVESGRIGSIEQVQAVNNVPYGAGYFSGHYRNWDESQGLWLQKATHDFDYINYLMKAKPVRLAALHSHRVFGKRKPNDLTCDKCDEEETCPESVYAEFYMHGNRFEYEPRAKHCAFGDKIGNQDNGSALIEYDNGVHACYTQNFMARRDAATRGATLIGYKGTISFDWYTNQVKVVMHHQSRTETIDCTSKHGHGGGDLELIVDFVSILKGKGKSRATIDDGILSAYMCLKARESAEKRRFMELDVTELDD